MSSEKMKVLGMMRRPLDLARGDMASTVVRNTSGTCSVMFCRLCRLRFRNFLNFPIRSKSFTKFTRCRTISELKLLIPKLSSRANSIIVRMTAEDLERYDEVKRFAC